MQRSMSARWQSGKTRTQTNSNRVGSRDRSGGRAVVVQRGGYVNYMQADEPIERVRATFGPKRSIASRR